MALNILNPILYNHCDVPPLLKLNRLRHLVLVSINEMNEWIVFADATR